MENNFAKALTGRLRVGLMHIYAMHIHPVAARMRTQMAGNNRPTHAAMSAALSTPETDVSKPGIARPASRITLIANLEVGQTYAQVEAVPPGMTVEQFKWDCYSMTEVLRNSVNSSLRHAKLKTGFQYTIESFEFIGASHSLYVGVVVRRTA